MPEGVEIELYRRAAEKLQGCQVALVDAPDPWFLKRGTEAAELSAELVGATVTAVDRIGKLLLLQFGYVGTLGIRFGMTGRLIVGEEAAIDKLEYSSARDEPAWDRFCLTLQCSSGPTTMRVNDPRRLGGVEWNPDVRRLGADLFRFKPRDISQRVAVGSIPIKARLMDQSRLAGVGNLIADETLWRAGIHPAREAQGLTPAELRRLIRYLRSVAQELLDNGGSHTGALQPSRVRGGSCPKCGRPLDRMEIGGRTTYACPKHQPLS